MNKIKIVTDSSAELTPEEIKEFNITVLPLSVMIDDVVYIDGENLSKVEFMEKMPLAKALPKSSQPPIGKFIETYDALGEEGSEIISIHITESLSGTVNAARQAAQLSKTNVTVLDSLFTDRGLSFQVIEAAKMAQKGASKEEILARIEHVKNNTKLYICVVTLENLVKGGRIGRVMGAISSLLNVKVMFELVGGNLEVLVRGRGMKPINQWITTLIETLKTKTNIKEIGFSHAAAFDYTNGIMQQFKEAFPNVPMPVRQTGPVIATHTGKGAFAIMYYTD